MAQQEKEQKVDVERRDPGKARAPARAEATRGGMPSTWAQMEREMQRVFDSLLSRRWMRPWEMELPELRLPFEGGLPKVDVIDRDEEVLVRAELPGVEKDDLDVSLGDGTVTIKAVAHKESREEKGDYFRHETASGEISRTVALPAEIDASRAKAGFKNGVLEVTLPKAEQSKRRQISIE